MKILQSDQIDKYSPRLVSISRRCELSNDDHFFVQIRDEENGSGSVLRWAHSNMNQTNFLIVPFEKSLSRWSAADALQGRTLQHTYLTPQCTICRYGFDTELHLDKFP